MKYAVPDHVEARDVHDEIVVLDARSNTYLGLNQTGAVVWSVLASGGTVDSAVTELVERFEVDQGQAAADAVALRDELVRLELLTPVSA